LLNSFNSYSTYALTSLLGLSVLTCLLGISYLMKGSECNNSALSSNNVYWLGKLRQYIITLIGVSKRGVKYSILPIFIGILLLNIVGFFPYYYTSTATILIPCIMGIMVSIVFFSLRLFKFQHYAFTHYVPKSKSTFLGVFIFVVEFMGLIIRSLSLGLRLTCNILCGHLLLSILSLFLLKFNLSIYEGILPHYLFTNKIIPNIFTFFIFEIITFIFTICIACIKLAVYFVSVIILTTLFVSILWLETLIIIVQAFIITKLQSQYVIESL